MIKKVIIMLIAGIIALSFSGCTEGGNIEDDTTETSLLDPIMTDDDNVITDDIPGEITGNDTNDIGDVTNGGSVTGDIQVPDNNTRGNLNGSGNSNQKSDGALGDLINGIYR